MPLGLCSPHSCFWEHAPAKDLARCPCHQPKQAGRSSLLPSFLSWPEGHFTEIRDHQPLAPQIHVHLPLLVVQMQILIQWLFWVALRVCISNKLPEGACPQPYFAEQGSKNMALFALFPPPKMTLSPYPSFEVQLKCHSQSPCLPSSFSGKKSLALPVLLCLL